METSLKVAVILFYDVNGNILIQDRREKSSLGEEYGFFGGKLEGNETPEEALKRELKEELELNLKDFELFKRYNYLNPQRGLVNRNIYLGKMPDLSKLVCHEGKPKFMKFKNSFNLKMIHGYNELLKEIYQSLVSKRKIIPKAI